MGCDVVPRYACDTRTGIPVPPGIYTVNTSSTDAPGNPATSTRSDLYQLLLMYEWSAAVVLYE